MIKKVTKKWLNSENACSGSLKYVIDNNYMDLSPIDFINKLMENNRFLDANWLIVRVMNKKQKVQYAIFAAELVLHIFEKKYLNNKRSKLAIEVTKNYIKNLCRQTRAAWDAVGDAGAAEDAWDAVGAAAWDAAEDARAAAWDAAWYAARDAQIDQLLTYF